MQQALALAKKAQEAGEVPVGALVVQDGKIIGSGFNQPIAKHDPCAHAEIQALQAAGQSLKNYRLPKTTLYVTLEPCAMCAGAMVHARVDRLVFGAADPRTGAAGSVMNLLQHSALNHQITTLGGVLADDCSAILKAFFQAKRKHKEERADA